MLMSVMLGEKFFFFNSNNIYYSYKRYEMAEVFSSPFPVRQLVSGDLNFDGNCRPRGSGAEDSRSVSRTVNLRQWRRRGICTGAGYETCRGSIWVSV